MKVKKLTILSVVKFDNSLTLNSKYKNTKWRQRDTIKIVIVKKVTKIKRVFFTCS